MHDAQDAARRGPRSVLCVVHVTRSAWSNGERSTPPAMRPATCATSAMSSAPTSSAIACAHGPRQHHHAVAVQRREQLLHQLGVRVVHRHGHHAVFAWRQRAHAAALRGLKVAHARRAPPRAGRARRRLEQVVVRRVALSMPTPPINFFVDEQVRACDCHLKPSPSLTVR